MAENKINNRAKKIIIRLLLSFLIFLLLLVISGFLIIYYNQETIKNIFIKELNKSLQSEISVKDIEFSVFDKFPNASLCFKDIVAKDAVKESKKDTLLAAESIFLEFDVWDLYYKTYIIRNIEINNAKLFLKTDKNGNDNFHFWKKGNQSNASNFNFSLKKILLQNVEVIYLNKAAQQFYIFDIEKASAKGDFSNQLQNIKLNANLNVKHFQSGEMLYLKNAKTVINTSLIINTSTENISFEKGDLQINNLDFSLTGSVSYKASQKTLNLTIKGKDISLHNLISELPATQKTLFEDYESKGIIDITVNIKGLYGSYYIPLIYADFNFRNGEVTQKQTELTLKNVKFTGNYTNNSSIDIQNHILKIENFSCNLEKSKISGNFTLNDFKNPYINCIANANLNLDEINRFFKNDKINSLQGSLIFNLNFRGKINKQAINIHDFINSKTTGQAILSNIRFSLKNDTRDYQISQGDLQFTNNDVVINILTGRISGSDFNLKGSFNNVIPFIFIENQKIEVNADLFSENINLDEIIGAKNYSNSKNKLQFSDNYNFNLNLNVNNINFRNFNAKNLKGNIKFMNPIFRADNLSMKSINGDLNGSLLIDNSKPDIYKINCEVITQKVDARQLFEVFENFGQKSLTYKNINGNLDSKIQFSANFDTYLQIDKKTVWAILDLKIDNGKLINYMPIMKLSKFINEDDLKEIKFSSLQNQILIKNELISIPNMEIKSNALNLNISGEHKFNNEINYRINLLLSELSSKKRKARKQKQTLATQEFGIEEDDGLGRTKLFLKVSGTIDSPIFKYDSKSLKDKLIQDFRKEKENLQKILKEEFRWLRKDSADAIQEQRFKIQEQGKYVIDWEEEKTVKPLKTSEKDSIPKSGIKIKWEED